MEEIKEEYGGEEGGIQELNFMAFDDDFFREPLEYPGEYEEEVIGEWGEIELDGEDAEELRCVLPPEEGEPLTRKVIHSGLSNIGRVAYSTQLAFLTCDLSSRNLNDVYELEYYGYLTTVLLCSNKLTSLLPLYNMKNLNVLNAQDNFIEQVEEIPFEDFKWLQALNLAKNLLSSFYVQLDSLLYLHLANNELNSIEYFVSKSFPNLMSLELRGNKLTSIHGIDLPSLRHLYIAENELVDLNGIDGCPLLELLHARQNRIRRFNVLFNMNRLEYVNLRSNDIRNISHVSQLENCTNLKTLILANNLVMENKHYKEALLAICISLKRIDKMVVTEMDIVEGLRFKNSGKLNAMLISESEIGENEEFEGEGQEIYEAQKIVLGDE